MSGSIFAIGGYESKKGEMPVLRAFVKCCGGASARILFITSASDDVEEKMQMYEPAIDGLRLKNATFLHLTGSRAKGHESHLQALERAHGVFFVGGSQAKLVTRVGASAFMDKLRQRHRQGLHLAGTSAGASAMSKVMIASGKAGLKADSASVRLTDGLGFIPEVIIDQHFRRRGRLGRLMSAVLQNPTLLGMGLDEDTAVEFKPNHSGLVHGSGCVTVVDAAGAQNYSGEAFRGLSLHSMTAGWTIDLRSRRPRAPASA